MRRFRDGEGLRPTPAYDIMRALFVVLPHVTGGVGDAEQAVMSARFGLYSYKLVNVKSGPEAAYVSNVHVVIVGDRGKKLLETTTDGPWLIANLTAGHYTIKATLDGVTKTRDFILHSDENQRMVIDWNPDSGVEESAKGS